MGSHVRLRCGARIAIASLALAALCSCTDAPVVQSGPSPTQNRASTPSDAATSGAPSGSGSSDVINLACGAGQTGLTGVPDKTFLGVTSDQWFARGGTMDLGRGGRPSYQGRTLIKSVLYVTDAARAGTRIEVVSPDSAALFYTSFTVWSAPDTGGKQRLMITGARPEVTLGGCGSSTIGFAGGIVVKGPSCVDMIISSADGRQREEFKVPIGRSC